jgi:hypothetical protein
MMTENQLKTLVGLAIVIWAGVLVFQHQTVSLHSLTPFSYVVTGLSAALVLWERWLWAWPVFHPWLTSQPDLRGTWKGMLVSDWIDPHTQQHRLPTEVYYVIRQTYSTIDIRMLTVESMSESLSGNVFSDKVGVYKLAVTYRNIPRLLERARSPVHHGGALLNLIGKPIHKLDGEYWTDRDTGGELTFTVRTRKIVHDFEEATRQEF